MEHCYGCNAESESHPVVAVMKFDESAERVALDPSKAWMAVPVCERCHQEPASRQRTIKATFFLRANQEIALRMVDMHGVFMPGK